MKFRFPILFYAVLFFATPHAKAQGIFDDFKSFWKDKVTPNTCGNAFLAYTMDLANEASQLANKQKCEKEYSFKDLINPEVSAKSEYSDWLNNQFQNIDKNKPSQMGSGAGLLKLLKSVKPDQYAEFKSFVLKNQTLLALSFSDSEKTVFKEEPIFGLWLAFTGDKAMKESEDIQFKEFKHHNSAYLGRADAYRHAIWNAYAGQFVPKAFVEKFMIAHEVDRKPKRKRKQENPDQPENNVLCKDADNKKTDHDMDFYNNAAGYEIGHNNRCESEDQLRSKVKSAITNGKMRIVINQNGCNWLMSSSYDLPTKVDKNNENGPILPGPGPGRTPAENMKKRPPPPGKPPNFPEGDIGTPLAPTPTPQPGMRY